MSQKSMGSHFLAIGSATIVNMIISFLTTPIITRLVDTNEYGQLSMFTLYGQIAMTVLILGLDFSLVRYYYNEDSGEYKHKLIQYCLKLPLALTAFATVVFGILLKFTTLTLDFSFSICVLLCIYVFLKVLYRVAELVVRCEQDSKLFGLLNIIQKLAYVVPTILLCIFVKQDYALILTGCTTFAVAVTLVMAVYKERHLWFGKNLKDKVNEAVTQKELLKYGAPFIVAALVAMVYEAMDKLFIKHFLGYSQVGIYSSAVAIVGIFAIVQSTFNTVWTPIAVEHYEKAPEDKQFYVDWCNKIASVMFFLGINIIFFKDIIVLLLGAKYRDAATIMPCLCLWPIMYTISEVTVGGITFMKKSKYNMVISIVSCLVNFAGNYLWVPTMGCKGAALSTGLSYIVFFSLRTYFSNKVYPIEYSLKRIYFMTALFALFAIYNTFFPFIVVNIMFYLILMFFTLILFRKEFKYFFSLLKKKEKTEEEPAEIEEQKEEEPEDEWTIAKRIANENIARAKADYARKHGN